MEPKLLLSINVTALFSSTRLYADKIVLAFYLILDVAVGGTSGWFPDGSEKPWLDGSASTYISMLAAQMIDHFFSCDG